MKKFTAIITAAAALLLCSCDISENSESEVSPETEKPSISEEDKVSFEEFLAEVAEDVEKEKEEKDEKDEKEEKDEISRKKYTTHDGCFEYSIRESSGLSFIKDESDSSVLDYFSFDDEIVDIAVSSFEGVSNELTELAEYMSEVISGEYDTSDIVEIGEKKDAIVRIKSYDGDGKNSDFMETTMRRIGDDIFSVTICSTDDDKVHFDRCRREAELILASVKAAD